MKIYTKTGDKGETSLYGGRRVRKDNPRVEAYGAIDETNAFIGFARAAIHEGSSGSREVLNYIDSVLEPVQHKLFGIGASLAGSDDPKYSIEENDIEFLEKAIDRMDEQVQPIKSFILPFGTDLCSRLHLARVIARNAERRIITLSQSEQVDPHLLAYANRLSDFLFTLARFANKAQGVPDVQWKKESKEKEPVIPSEKQEKLAFKEPALIESSPTRSNGNGHSNGH
ncbi:MAG: cob(I)yrinic acid a,c-diamide adenosyltransferase [Nitrososphaerales archaeon]